MVAIHIIIGHCAVHTDSTYCWQEEIVDDKCDKSYEVISEKVATNIGER